jgi:hypothetical protein
MSNNSIFFILYDSLRELKESLFIKMYWVCSGTDKRLEDVMKKLFSIMLVMVLLVGMMPAVLADHADEDHTPTQEDLDLLEEIRENAEDDHDDLDDDKDDDLDEDDDHDELTDAQKELREAKKEELDALKDEHKELREQQKEEMDALKDEQKELREQRKEELKEIRTDIKERIKEAKKDFRASKARHAQLRKEFKSKRSEIKEEHKSAKSSLDALKKEYRAACKDKESDECVAAKLKAKSSGKDYLLNTADRMLGFLFDAQERLENAGLDNDKKVDLEARISSRITDVEAAKSVIDELTDESSKDDYKDAASALRQAWSSGKGNLESDIKHIVKRVYLHNAKAKFAKYLDQAQLLQEKLQGVIDRLDAQDVDTSGFESILEEAKSVYAEAESLLDSGDANAAKEKLREVKSLFKKARAELKEVLSDLKAKHREAANELREAGKAKRIDTRAQIQSTRADARDKIAEARQEIRSSGAPSVTVVTAEDGSLVVQ